MTVHAIRNKQWKKHISEEKKEKTTQTNLDKSHEEMQEKRIRRGI